MSVADHAEEFMPLKSIRTNLQLLLIFGAFITLAVYGWTEALLSAVGEGSW